MELKLDDSKTVTAYSYEGTEIDGSTKIEAESATANGNAFLRNISQTPMRVSWRKQRRYRKIA